MKKSYIFLIIGAVVLLLALGIGSSYNGLVGLREDVENGSSNVSVMLERRADLIPNLVKTVKGYAAHEEKVITAVTDARKELMGAKTIDEKAKANDELSSALNRLMVVVENYPDLKANENFVALQDELAGTENRIATARKDYNDAVKKYNTKIKKFPTNLLASMFGFEKEDYFEVSDAKTEVPDVEF